MIICSVQEPYHTSVYLYFKIYLTTWSLNIQFQTAAGHEHMNFFMAMMNKRFNLDKISIHPKSIIQK